MDTPSNFTSMLNADPNVGGEFKKAMIPTEKKYQLPKDFAQKWVRSLTNGDYKQGSKVLCVGGEYCCLGVACAIVGIDAGDNLEGFPSRLKVDTSNLPDILREWPENYNITDVGERNLVAILARMNDDGKTFPEIADAGWGFGKG